MKIYLVGGAVRDALLGLPVKERDWVVVGATPAEMLRLGYRQVGKDFPVFLHPETHEEYALARVERKVGRGYTGFDFDASPSVTLEQDLLRRDLTINAIAQHSEGELVDPYLGQNDLTQKILRHVSPAFVEDPVRVLRVGRFAARFSVRGFRVAEETIALMQSMVAAGEVDALVPERVWKELSRALEEETPTAFFDVLRACDALPILFPALTTTGLLRLQHMALHSQEADIRFAALLSDTSTADCLALCDRYRVPSQFRELALLVTTHTATCERAEALQATEWLALLRATDAFRREARFEKFLLVSEAITKIPLSFVKAILGAAKQVDVQPFIAKGITGPALAAAIDARRIELIDSLLLTQQPRAQG